MTYEPKTWVCGETITAEALNHLEQGLADCCGGGGFACNTVRTTEFDGSVTTEDDGGDAYGTLLAYKAITSDTIVVTFNGVAYTCDAVVEKDGSDTLYAYGAPWDSDLGQYDWSEYPFSIGGEVYLYGDDETFIATDNAGTYSVKVESVAYTAEVSKCFEAARGYGCNDEVLTPIYDEIIITMSDGNRGEGVIYPASPIDAETITVTFNGVEYECNAMETSEDFIYHGIAYGGYVYPQTFDFSVYPFVIIYSANGDSYLITETPGEYSLTVELTKSDIETTPCFEKAVEQIINSVSEDSNFIVNFSFGDNGYHADRTFAEIEYAYRHGKTVEGRYNYNGVSIVYPLASISTQDGEMRFHHYTPSSTAVYFDIFVLQTDETITHTSMSINS